MNKIKTIRLGKTTLNALYIDTQTYRALEIDKPVYIDVENVSVEVVKTKVCKETNVELTGNVSYLPKPVLLPNSFNGVRLTEIAEKEFLEGVKTNGKDFEMPFRFKESDYIIKYDEDENVIAIPSVKDIHAVDVSK